MEDVFFGDACPRSREMDRWYVESRIMSKGNRATSSSSLPLPTENACNFRPMGGIYITRARKTAIRPTELRLYRGRVCACLSLFLSLATNFRLEISAGTHASHVRAGVIKIWPHVGKNKKKRRGRKTQFEIK